MARGLKFRIYVEEELYYPYSENKGADQLCSYCAADLRLFFAYAKSRFSHEEAQMIQGRNIPDFVILNLFISDIKCGAFPTLYKQYYYLNTCYIS